MSKQKAKSKGAVRLVHPDNGPVGEMASIGGSRSDDWNSHFFNSLANGLPEKSPLYSEETRQAAFSALAVGLVEGKPADPIEAMLIGQIIVASATANELHRRTWIKDQPFLVVSKFLALADKAQRTVGLLVEALNRHRGKGQQKVTVEHVHVHAGGQAIVGSVSRQGGGVTPKIEEQPHAKATNASLAPLQGAIEADGAAVPIPSGGRV